jgi:hypothetical protein
LIDNKQDESRERDNQSRKHFTRSRD